jgi:hypothetical protein
MDCRAGGNSPIFIAKTGEARQIEGARVLSMEAQISLDHPRKYSLEFSHAQPHERAKGLLFGDIQQRLS